MKVQEINNASDSKVQEKNNAADRKVQENNNFRDRKVQEQQCYGQENSETFMLWKRKYRKK